MDPLTLWWRNVALGRDGQRPDRSSSWRVDALYLAACYEAAAREADGMGLANAATSDRRKAAEIIVKAAAVPSPQPLTFGGGR